LRSSIADYEVMRVLSSTAAGQRRYLCRPPERLHETADEVMITELAVPPTRTRDVAGSLCRLAAIRSDRLLRLIEVGPDFDADGTGMYLATESAPGATAAEPASPLDTGAKIRVIAEAAQGAHAMHETGLAHGRIDANAIVLTARGAVLAPPPVEAPPGAVAGVRDWRNVVVLDPAVLRGEPPSRSSDVWALAATLHLLLSTRPLYPGIDQDLTVTAVQRVLFTRPEIDAALPASLIDALGACFADDPGQRPETAAELAALLVGNGGRPSP
jgi:eukaryotic-like serine/threonine-protein kinase